MNFTQVVTLVHLGQGTAPAVYLVVVAPKQEIVLTVLVSHQNPGHVTRNLVVSTT